MEHDQHTIQEKEEIMYTCPMHPEVRKSEPGKCPGCGMDLIPKAVAAKRNAAAHAGHDMQKMSHMDHESAMTNPQMAKAMEADMRRRFLVSFVLSVPIFLYSPVGINFFGLDLPAPIPVNWILLVRLFVKLLLFLLWFFLWLLFLFHNILPVLHSDSETYFEHLETH